MELSPLVPHRDAVDGASGVLHDARSQAPLLPAARAIRPTSFSRWPSLVRRGEGSGAGSRGSR